MGDTSRTRKLERILEISRELTSTVALEPLLHKIVRVASELTASEAASILLLDTRTGELRFRAASSDPQRRLFDIPVPVEDSIAGQVLLCGEPIVIADALHDPRIYQPVGQQVGLQTRSLLAVPLNIKERRIGVLEAVNKSTAFDQEDVEVLTALASQAAVAIENARLVGDLRRAYDRLGELDRLKSDFIAIASHELRTPLSMILLYAAMLREQMGEEIGTELDAVLRAAMRLRHIIETMLNLRYLETGQMELTIAPFDLRGMIEEAVEDYRTIAASSGLALKAALPKEQVSFWGDMEKMRVVLDNLISNAVKFTPAGGEVLVSLYCRDKWIHMQVADTGIGIPLELQGRIFDRFYQVEDHMTRRHGGMGLGLSIVKGLVELHGGRVRVESAPGKGSCFTVELPVEGPGTVAPALG